MKKKNIITISASIFVLVVITISSTIIANQYAAQSDGTIEVELVDLDNSIEEDKIIQFDNGDSLIFLLESNFSNVDIENGMLMSIGTFTTASDWSTFISIYVDNEMSLVGIEDISFIDGTIISLKMTEYDPNY